MSNELLTTIARVRRAMPRNADVMAICEALENAIVKRRADMVVDQVMAPNKSVPLIEGLRKGGRNPPPGPDFERPAPPAPIPHLGPGFDKKAYQRELMRKRRAKAKLANSKRR